MVLLLLIDVFSSICRLSMVHPQLLAPLPICVFLQVKAGIEQAKKLIDLGGDWDRRNRLKVYEAVHLITARDVKGAAALLLECVSTFTCTELCSYNDFILYTVVTNVLILPRTTFKKKIVDGPEVCMCLFFCDINILGERGVVVATS